MVNMTWSIENVSDVCAFLKRAQEMLGQEHWVGSRAPLSFKADARMVVTGLVQRPELNGLKGTIKEHNEETGRFRMLLENNCSVNIRQGNLFPLFPPLRIDALPVRGGMPVSCEALGCSEIIAGANEIVFERIGTGGWRDPRLSGEGDTERPHFQLSGKFLTMRRMTVLSDAKQQQVDQQMTALIAEFALGTPE